MRDLPELNLNLLLSLEALLAERDAFSARVSRVQADADLGYARVLLRIAAARRIEGEVTR